MTQAALWAALSTWDLIKSEFLSKEYQSWTLVAKNAAPIVANLGHSSVCTCPKCAIGGRSCGDTKAE